MGQSMGRSLGGAVSGWVDRSAGRERERGRRKGRAAAKESSLPGRWVGGSVGCSVGRSVDEANESKGGDGSTDAVRAALGRQRCGRSVLSRSTVRTSSLLLVPAGRGSNPHGDDLVALSCKAPLFLLTASHRDASLRSRVGSSPRRSRHDVLRGSPLFSYPRVL